MYRIVKTADPSIKFGKYPRLIDALDCLSVWNEDGEHFSLKIEI